METEMFKTETTYLPSVPSRSNYGLTWLNQPHCRIWHWTNYCLLYIPLMTLGWSGRETWW